MHAWFLDSELSTCYNWIYRSTSVVSSVKWIGSRQI